MWYAFRSLQLPTIIVPPRQTRLAFRFIETAFAALNVKLVFANAEGYGLISTCPTSSPEFPLWGGGGGGKALGVATAPRGYIRALTIFARDSYGQPIHFHALIVTTVDSRRRLRLTNLLLFATGSLSPSCRTIVPSSASDKYCRYCNIQPISI